MGRKITAFHINTQGGKATVRALSKSRRGSTFTLDSATVKTGGRGKEEMKQAISQAIDEAILASKR